MTKKRMAKIKEEVRQEILEENKIAKERVELTESIDKAVEIALPKWGSEDIEDLIRLVAYELERNPEDKFLRGFIHLSLAKHHIQDREIIRVHGDRTVRTKGSWW